MCEDNKLSTKRSFNAFMINLCKKFDDGLHNNKANGILNKNHG